MDHIGEFIVIGFLVSFAVTGYCIHLTLNASSSAGAGLLPYTLPPVNYTEIFVKNDLLGCFDLNYVVIFAVW
jgi:hypothetical protein